MTRRVCLVAGLSALAALHIGGLAREVLAVAQDLTQREADSMERKLSAIEGRGGAPRGTDAAPVETSFTEREVNAYFKYNAQARMPKGILAPQILIAGGGRLEGRAIVDLDAVRTSKPRGWLDLANLLRGAVEVKASGVLQTADGRGTFRLESATWGGLVIPRGLLQELVSYYSRTPDNPAGFDFDKPFYLPANVREVHMQRGAATIIQ